MTDAVGPAVECMRQLGRPDELAESAERGARPGAGVRVNAHVHLPPNFSAFRTVAEAVDLAAEQGVGVLGASNYYDFSAYAELAGRASERNVFPLFGLEILAMLDDLVAAGVRTNDPGNPGKMYICGKGIVRFDPMTDEAGRLMGVIRENDSARMARMVGRLAEVFRTRRLDTGLDADAVIDRVVARHDCPRGVVYLQERHVAQAFQEIAFERIPHPKRRACLTRILGVAPKGGGEDPVSVQNEIRSQMMKAGKPAYVEETFINFEDSYRLICELGGIPCYPVLADGILPMTEFETSVRGLVDTIRDRGIHCAEFIPLRNEPAVLTEYVTGLREAGLAIAAGTEHNTLDMVPIEPTCVGGQPVPDAIKEIFREGACVVAAHQYLVCHGKGGFVDERGGPNANYATDEARIEAFAELGAAVIDRYHQMHA